MKRSSLFISAILLSILALSACRKYETSPAIVPHLLSGSAAGVTISSPSHAPGTWLSYGIGEFLFTYPSEWQPGAVTKMNGGIIEVPFFGSEGTAVALLDCPIQQDAYPAPYTRESRAFSRQSIDYGVDLWTGSSSAILLFHLGDLAHWKDNDHAKRSCQLVAKNADGSMKAIFKKILESAH